MQTCLLHFHHGSSFIPFPATHLRRPSPLPITLVKTKHFTAARRLETTVTANPDAGMMTATEKKAKHSDTWFDLLAINYLTSRLRVASGYKRMMKKRGYDGLVEAAAIISGRHAAAEQQNIVIEVLDNAFPPAILYMSVWPPTNITLDTLWRAASNKNVSPYRNIVVMRVSGAPSLIRRLLTPSKFTRELFAGFTTIFFTWLVGPCEVRDMELHGKREKNVVYIQKCRFLEATNCAGMCINLCKLPSQKFISTRLGIPTTMVPNFEDKSCEIIFGQIPPADDQALKQPCYQTSCIAKQNHGVDCSS